MAEPKAILTLAGVKIEPKEASEDSSGDPNDIGIPLHPMSLAAAIAQLQNTVNEVIVRLNAIATATAHETDKVTGEGQGASALFTTS